MQWGCVRAILCDISGVLYDSNSSGGVAIAGSIQAVQRLQASGLPYRFVTNESQTTRSRLAAQLRSLGFPVEEGDITSPVTAVRSLLLQRGWKAHLLVHPAIRSDLSDVAAAAGSSADCVVLADAGDQFSYESLNAAFQLLVGSCQRRLVSLGRGRYYRSDGNLVLDVGAFAAALEFAASCSAEVVGKPSADFFAAAIAELPATARDKKDEILMVGDDIVSDVGAAQQFGLRAVQVRTGKFTGSDEPHPTVQPDAYADNLLEVVQRVLG